MLHRFCQTYYIPLTSIYQSPTGLAGCCGVHVNVAMSTLSPDRAECGHDIGQGVGGEAGTG